MDVFSGHVFVFLARKPNRAKMLWWDGGGFVVWYKRLETGCFKPPAQNEHAVVHIDAVALAMLLQGIDVKKVQRPKLWRPRIAS
jgi:transposase